VLSYRVLITADILNLERPALRDRDAIIAFADSLKTDPTKVGDYSEPDESGRTVQIKLIGTYALTYWADHAVREVKITKVEKAD
jgi:hypothetical protein